MMIKFKIINKSKLVACMLSVGISTTFVSCVTDDDEDGVELEGQEPVEEDAPAAPAEATAPAKVEAEKPAEKVEEVPAAPQQVEVPSAATPTPVATVPTSNVQRRVMYVKENGTPVRSSADKSGKVVSKLKKGDHILVNIEGEWARTDQGTFISIENLSEKGIGRGGKSNPTWNASHPNPTAKAKKKNKKK